MGGDVTITGRLDGVADGVGGTAGAAESLTIIAGTGNVVIQGDIGGTEALENLTIVSAGSVTINGRINVRGRFQIVKATGLVNIGVPLVVGNPARDVTAGTLDVTSTDNIIFEGNVLTTLVGSPSIQVATNTASGTITFKQNVTSAGDLRITAARNLLFTGSTSVVGAMKQLLINRGASKKGKSYQ